MAESKNWLENIIGGFGNNAFIIFLILILLVLGCGGCGGFGGYPC